MTVKKLSVYLAIFGFGVVAAWGVPALLDLFDEHHHDMHYERDENSDHHGQHGKDHHQHNEMTMPGLQGKDISDDEVNDLKTLFRAHKDIDRHVENIPNGIKTITESNNPQLRDAIVNHVAGMVARLDQGQNPEVIIQSPTLDGLFRVHELISTEIEVTENGIAVIQTSNDPAVVRALQTHAAEVSDMAKRGMAAVHERMAGGGAKRH